MISNSFCLSHPSEYLTISGCRCTTLSFLSASERPPARKSLRSQSRATTVASVPIRRSLADPNSSSKSPSLSRRAAATAASSLRRSPFRTRASVETGILSASETRLWRKGSRPTSPKPGMSCNRSGCSSLDGTMTSTLASAPQWLHLPMVCSSSSCCSLSNEPLPRMVILRSEPSRACTRSGSSKEPCCLRISKASPAASSASESSSSSASDSSSVSLLAPPVSPLPP
mmetsp:Transcript_14808/g.47609  ORF Transcript_14808/g.47609 Transcript_14808/m.47609 type:complete len:228 (+) Transcript_14808:2033-2716(+)